VTPSAWGSALGLIALVLGLLAWLWLGDWRYAVTGLLVMIVLVVASNPREKL
jgi:hypothetical protein